MGDVETVSIPFDELVPGSATRVMVGDVAVAVVRIDDEVYAIGDRCSHANVSLASGDVYAEDREIECPQHGSMFSLVTGDAHTLPATQPVPVFDVSIADGIVTIVRGERQEGAR
jgi:3-phenylpropionate/trans-cinnamate dioxygenase ferredoxin component